MGKQKRNAELEVARAKLKELWERACSPTEMAGPKAGVPAPVLDSIEETIQGHHKTYPYILVTQVFGKLLDGRRNALTLQKKSTLVGSWDARSLCHDVIVPFARNIGCAWGTNAQPYANNPARLPHFTLDQRAEQKAKMGFDHVCAVLDYVQSNTNKTEPVFLAVLAALRRRVAASKVQYEIPNRMSAAAVEQMIDVFLSERTGGERLQVVVAALFVLIGRAFGLFDEVASNPVNASDLSTGSVADLECHLSDGRLRLAVEVKDRPLALSDLQTAAAKMRRDGVRELAFVSRGGVVDSDFAAVSDRMASEFHAGQSIHVFEFNDLLGVTLGLFDDVAKRGLIEEIGARVDATGNLDHRHALKTALRLL